MQYPETSNKRIPPHILSMYVGSEALFYGASDLWKLYSSSADGGVVLKNGLHTEVVHEGNLLSHYDFYLRTLEDLTEQEARYIYKLATGMVWEKRSEEPCLEQWWNMGVEDSSLNEWLLVGIPTVWSYLLWKGFDLFKLIEQGLAKAQVHSSDVQKVDGKVLVTGEMLLFEKDVTRDNGIYTLTAVGKGIGAEDTPVWSDNVITLLEKRIKQLEEAIWGTTRD